MNFTRNVKGISSFLLVLLLLAALIVGAVLSYLWVIGYYINLGLRLPEKPALSITNVTFNPQNTSYLTVTVLNPSYSPDAIITGIAALTEDGVVHPVTETIPTFPYGLPTAEETSFEGVWNWANYTGEILRMVVFAKEGSGPIFEASTPLVDLKIKDLTFNSTISVTNFNVTVQNNAQSVTYVNITEVTMNGNYIPAENLSIPLPYLLYPNESVFFESAWNWTEYQGNNVTVAVRTLQGYVAYNTSLTSKPVILSINNIFFDASDMIHFNVTVQNSIDSPTYVNITDIMVGVENKTFTYPDVQVLSPPQFPYSLFPNSNVTFRCEWNWTLYRERNVTVTVYTLQGFQESYTQASAARVILNITKVLFDVDDPSYFNVTVKNFEFSEEVNATRVMVLVEDETPQNITITPPAKLLANESVTFTGHWNWSAYWNKEVSITVHAENYHANYSTVTPSPVLIYDVLFNLNDTQHFNVTVENSKFFYTYILVTRTTAILENGNVQEVTVTVPTRLPYVLYPEESVIFVCSWDWSPYQGQTVAIKVETFEGYEVIVSDIFIP